MENHMLNKEQLQRVHNYYHTTYEDKAKAEHEYNAYLDFCDKIYKQV